MPWPSTGFDQVMGFFPGQVTTKLPETTGNPYIYDSFIYLFIIYYYLLLFIIFIYYYYYLLFIIIYLLLLFIYYYHLIMTIMIYYYYYYDCSWLRYRTWAQPGFHVPTRSEGCLKSGWEQPSEEARARGRREPGAGASPTHLDDLVVTPMGFNAKVSCYWHIFNFQTEAKKHM